MNILPDPDRPCYADAVSGLREHIDSIGTSLAVWSGRREPDARARRAANDAMDALDEMSRELYPLRTALIDEMRASDDAAMPAWTSCSASAAG